MKTYNFKSLGLCISLTILCSPFAYAEGQEALDMQSYAIKNYSENHKVSKSEATRRLNIMENNTLFDVQMEKELGDTIVGSWYVNGPDFKIVYRTTKTGVPSTMFKDFGNNIKVAVEILPNAKVSKIKARDIVTKARQDWSTKIQNYQEVDYDPRDETIVLTVYEPNANKPLPINIEQLSSQVDGLKVKIVRLEEKIENVAIRGGGRMERSTTSSGADFGGTNCTIGFPAIRFGVEGFISAAHCVDRSNPYGTKFLLNTAIDQKTQKPVVWDYANAEVGYYNVNEKRHDIAFYKNTNNTMSNEFYFNDSLNSVYRTGAPLFLKDFKIGQQLCHFGNSTGYSCGTIFKIDADATYNNPNGCPASSATNGATKCTSTFVVLQGKDLRVEKGDSGGPIFSKERPAGILSAQAGSVGNKYAYFSPLDYLSEMSVTLK